MVILEPIIIRLIYVCHRLNLTYILNFEFIFSTRKCDISEILKLLSLYENEVNPVKNEFVLQIIADKITTVNDMEKLNELLKTCRSKGTIYHELEANLSHLKILTPRMEHDDSDSTNI